MSALAIIETLAMVGMGGSLVALSARFWRGRSGAERASLALFAAAGCAVLLWQGPSLVGLTEDDFPASESAETAFFFLLAGALFVWSSALLQRHARMLERALAAEREAVEQKQMYLDILGHDVRNPLTAAMLQVDVIALTSGKPSPDLGKVKQSLQRINKIVGDSLLYSKLDSTSVAAADRAMPLLTAATLAISTAEMVAAPKGVRIELAAPSEVPELVHPLFQHAIENLLSNAIKWSPGGSVVRLRVERGPEGWLVAVEDHGAGVPDDVKPRLFRRFERGKPGDVSGTGLGLAITRRVALAHGASIAVRDTPGGGATFEISLPTMGSAEGALAATLARGEVLQIGDIEPESR